MSRAIIRSYQLTAGEVLEVRPPETADVYRYTIVCIDRTAILVSTQLSDLAAGLGLELDPTAASAGARQLTSSFTFDRRGMTAAKENLYFLSQNTSTLVTFVIIWECEIA